VKSQTNPKSQIPEPQNLKIPDPDQKSQTWPKNEPLRALKSPDLPLSDENTTENPSFSHKLAESEPNNWNY
jgi:hypothetical protein